MAPRGSKKRRSNRESRLQDYFDEDYSRSSFSASSFNPFSSSSYDLYTWFSSLSSTKLLLYGGAFVIFAVTFLDPSLLGTLLSPQRDGDRDAVGDALPHVTKDGKYHGRYPNSLLTLFYPFTLLRDVVLDQPVAPADGKLSTLQYKMCCFDM
jgi:hypothetical protein